MNKFSTHLRNLTLTISTRMDECSVLREWTPEVPMPPIVVDAISEHLNRGEEEVYRCFNHLEAELKSVVDETTTCNEIYRTSCVRIQELKDAVEATNIEYVKDVLRNEIAMLDEKCQNASNRLDELDITEWKEWFSTYVSRNMSEKEKELFLGIVENIT